MWSVYAMTEHVPFWYNVSINITMAMIYWQKENGPCDYLWEMTRHTLQTKYAHIICRRYINMCSAFFNCHWFELSHKISTIIILQMCYPNYIHNIFGGFILKKAFALASFYNVTNCWYPNMPLCESIMAYWHRIAQFNLVYTRAFNYMSTLWNLSQCWLIDHWTSSKFE